jgi:hypothetical protein
MAVFQKFNCFVEAVHEKKHNLGSDTLKFLLTNNAPSQAWTQKSDVTGELTTGGGYTAGGATVTVTSSAQSGGLYTLIADDVTFTGSGGGFGPFRYAILFNDTATNDDLIGWIDWGYGISVSGSQTFTIDLDQTTGLYYAT